jgi:hypothetical protein
MTRQPTHAGANRQGRPEREPLRVQRAPLNYEGPLTAIYPYAQLREIQNPADCRRIALDETSPLETEFGALIVQPLYDLLWTLNCGAGVFTSHTAVAKPGHRAPYDWAKHYVAVAIITLSRNNAEHFDSDACQQACDELGCIITATAPTQDYTGWYLSVGPCSVTFTSDMSLTTFQSFLPGDTNGFGCQLIIGGSANNRRTAALRWSKAITFVNDNIKRTQTGTNAIPAAPHQHALHGALPTAAP